MRTYLDCIPCFYYQVLKTVRISGSNEEIQREALNRLSELVPDFSLDMTPAEMGRKIYAMVNKVTGKKDPYREIKEESNKMALKLYSRMKNKMKETEEQLLTAIRLAIIGNVIDFGIKDNAMIQTELDTLLVRDFDLQVTHNGDHFDYLDFHQHLLEVE